MINARAETVAVKPAFRAAFARRRCLIPADGYYEWQLSPGGATPRTPRGKSDEKPIISDMQTSGKSYKQPYYIYRTDGGILAFAGIYELWRNAQVPEDHEDAWYWSGSIITTDATDDIGKIHDRTPMVIAPDDWADWLDPANGAKEHLLAIMHPAMSSGRGGLTARAVSTAVNSVRNNGPDLVVPLASAGGS